MAAIVPAIDEIRQVIRARLRSEKVASKTAIIRQVLPDIEAATSAGFTYGQIALWLRDGQGFAISGKHLSAIVSELRKRKKRSPMRTNTQLKASTQLNMFEKLKTDSIALEKKFNHDPVADAEELM
jgi:hypothetical protein